MFKQGDIVWFQFGPGKGHEQRGFRPGLIISNDTFNMVTRLYEVCSISTNTKNFPTHIMLDESTKTKGAVFVEHSHVYDLSAREATFVEKCPDHILNKVINLKRSFYKKPLS